MHWWAPIVAAAAMIAVIATMIRGKGRRAVRAPLTAACAALAFIILNALLAEFSAAFAVQVPVSLGGVFERIFCEFILTYEAWAAFVIALVAAAPPHRQ